MLNRVAHDEALVDLAKSRGAEYLVNSRVDSIDGNTSIKKACSETAILTGAVRISCSLISFHFLLF